MYYYLLGLLIITIIIIITYYYIIIFYCYYFIYIIYILYYIYIYMIIIYLLLLYVYSNTSLFCSWMIHICFQGTIYMPKICQPAHLRRQLSAWLALKAADCSRFHRNMALDEGQCPAALSQPATGLQWRLLVVGLALMRNFKCFQRFFISNYSRFCAPTNSKRPSLSRPVPGLRIAWQRRAQFVGGWMPPMHRRTAFLLHVSARQRDFRRFEKQKKTVKIWLRKWISG